MDCTIMRHSSRSSATRQLWTLQARVTGPDDILPHVPSRALGCPLWLNQDSFSSLSRPQILLFPRTVGSTDLWTTEEDTGATKAKKKKIIFPLPPISGTGQKKFSGIASSSATAAARLCCWYFWGFAPKWVREIRVTHKSEVQRLAGGWVSAGLFYCLFESAGKALLRIKAKSDLGSSGDGKSWTKLGAVSVPALVALD